MLITTYLKSYSIVWMRQETFFKVEYKNMLLSTLTSKIQFFYVFCDIFPRYGNRNLLL